jgi:hypothetical protein
MIQYGQKLLDEFIWGKNSILTIVRQRTALFNKKKKEKKMSNPKFFFFLLKKPL